MYQTAAIQHDLHNSALVQAPKGCLIFWVEACCSTKSAVRVQKYNGTRANCDSRIDSASMSIISIVPLDLLQNTAVVDLSLFSPEILEH